MTLPGLTFPFESVAPCQVAETARGLLLRDLDLAIKFF